MKVREIMRRIVHTIGADDTLDVASKHIAHENISLLPVVEEAPVAESHLPEEVVKNLGFMPVTEEEVLVGVITTRDIVVRAIASDKDPKKTHVSEIMTQELAYCQENDDITDALAIMERRKVRRLFTLDSQNRVVGIVSRHDLWRARNGTSSQDITPGDS